MRECDQQACSDHRKLTAIPALQQRGRAGLFAAGCVRTCVNVYNMPTLLMCE